MKKANIILSGLAIGFGAALFFIGSVLNAGALVRDPEYALALAITGPKSSLDAARVRLALAFGADPDAALEYWDHNEPAIVVAIERGKMEESIILARSSSAHSLMRARHTFCSNPEKAKEIIKHGIPGPTGKALCERTD